MHLWTSCASNNDDLSIHLKGPDCSAACYFHIVGSSVGMEMILLPEIVVLSMVSCRRIDHANTLSHAGEVIIYC